MLCWTIPGGGVLRFARLADLFDLLENFFPNIPIILDSKRGDIATSSRNYADEAFKRWRANARSPLPPIWAATPRRTVHSGFHVWNIHSQSNEQSRGKDLQNLILHSGIPLYEAVAKQIIAYNAGKGHVGAVVGATNPEELKAIAKHMPSSRFRC